MNKRLGETNKEFAARIRETTAQMMEDQTRRITTLTRKDAAFTVDIRTPDGLETFIYYDGESMGNIIQALYAAQHTEAANR